MAYYSSCRPACVILPVLQPLPPVRSGCQGYPGWTGCVYRNARSPVYNCPADGLTDKYRLILFPYPALPVLAMLPLWLKQVC